MKRIWAALVLVGTASAAVAAPRMEGFEAIAAAGERLDMTGVGWARSGRFMLGDVTGSFRRDLDRRRFGGAVLLVEHAGGLTFELAASDGRARLNGDCALDQVQEQVRAGAVSVSAAVEPLRKRCAFQVDGRQAGELTLHAAFRRRAGVETLRAGSVRLGGVELAIRSVHRFERSRWPSADPLGYVLERDGRAVAAVDLNGARKRMALPQDPATRDAALAASVTLALFWDPGDQD